MKRCLSIGASLLFIVSCSDDGPQMTSETASESSSDSDPNGDGDGDPATASGDGDGDDPSTTDGDGDGDDPSTTNGDGDGDDPPPDPELEPQTFTRVTPAPEGGEVRVAHCAVDPTGNIYVAWMQSVGDAVDIYISSSTDGGQSFGAPVAIEDGPDTPTGGSLYARKPYVATDGERVAVAYGAVGPNYTGVRISTGLEPLSFGPLVEVGTLDAEDFEDFPKAVFSPEGEVWVSWHWTVPGVSEAKMVSRESEGWAAEDISGDAPGLPCECCPHDIRVNAAGDTLFAYRNNIDDLRDQWVARDVGSSSGFSIPVLGSGTEWTIPACPVSGPRLSETQGGRQLLVWSDPTSGAQRAWIASSEDGGASWGNDALISDGEEGQTSPVITTAADGRVLVAYAVGPEGRLTGSLDDGQSFVAPFSVDTDEGPLARIELCSGPTLTGMVGVTPANSLWWAGD